MQWWANITRNWDLNCNLNTQGDSIWGIMIRFETLRCNLIWNFRNSLWTIVKSWQITNWLPWRFKMHHVSAFIICMLSNAELQQLTMILGCGTLVLRISRRYFRFSKFQVPIVPSITGLVRHFPPLWSGPPFSSPMFTTPAIRSVIFHCSTHPPRRLHSDDNCNLMPKSNTRPY